MILEFQDHEYVDMDKVMGLRWVEDPGAGIIILDGNKMVVQTKEAFDVIEAAFIYLHKSHMIDDKLKKVRFLRREIDGI
jgi:hypothetical protein